MLQKSQMEIIFIILSLLLLMNYTVIFKKKKKIYTSPRSPACEPLQPYVF